MKNTKKMLCVIMLLVVTLPATSQSLQEYIRSRAGNADSLVLKAVSPALTIIRQQYRLERDGEYYGKNKRPFYGETYTLGVKVSGGTIFQRGVAMPWENDADYHRVEQDGKYKPAMYWSWQRSLSDSIWKTVELELGTQYVSPIDRDSLLFRHADAMSDFGLPVDETLGNKKGYIVWAYSNTNVEDSTMQVSLRQVNHQLETSIDSVYYHVYPKDADKIIGGIFVIPVIERAGYIKLQIAGIAAKNKDTKWVLHLLGKHNNVLKKMNGQTKKEKSKRKKNNESENNAGEVTDDFEPTPIK